MFSLGACAREATATASVDERFEAERFPETPNGRTLCPLRRPRGGHRRAESQAGRRATGARRRCSDRWLLANELVDEINLLIVPVVLRRGTRLFPGAGPDIALDLADPRVD